MNDPIPDLGRYWSTAPIHVTRNANS